VGSVTSPTSTSGAVSTYKLAAGAFTPTSTGTYCFTASYNGDGNYTAVPSESDPAAECFTVTLATPGVTTSPAHASIVLGSGDSDTATVTGVTGVTPTGSVTFYVCGPTATCHRLHHHDAGVVDLGSVTVSGSGNTATATSPSFTPLATGTYCFLGVYSGDNNYAGGRTDRPPGSASPSPRPPPG
jgi:hypothetical protein